MEVLLSNQARKFLDRIGDSALRSRLFGMIDALSSNPIPYKKYDVKKIKGMKNSYRLRKGDIRIQYAFSGKTKTVYVTAIKRREQAYR